MNRQPIYPLPEAIDGSTRWTIRPGIGSVDLVGRALNVPLGASAADLFVRAHELAHAKITPRHSADKLCRKYGIPMDAMQAVEDLRVHLFLSRLNIARPQSVSANTLEYAATHSSERELAGLLVASVYTDDHPLAMEVFSTHVNEGVMERLQEGVGLIARRLKASGGIFRRIGFRNGTVPAARLFDELFPAEPTAMQVPIHALSEACRHPRQQVGWGKLEIRTLQASHMHRAVPSSTRGYTDEGCVLAAPYRWCTDQRIFITRKTHQGGSVLIDVSGSMAITHRDLAKIIKAAPAATVAVYSGRGSKGILTVVGSNGRIATQDGLAQSLRAGSGNVVDGPALEWLAEQSEPRLWVSDGMVTGSCDRASADLAVDAQRICRLGRITRVSKLDAVQKAIRPTRSNAKSVPFGGHS